MSELAQRFNALRENVKSMCSEGVNLPNTLTFDYPTISSIADFSASQMGPAPAGPGFVGSPAFHGVAARPLKSPCRRPWSLAPAQKRQDTGAQGSDVIASLLANSATSATGQRVAEADCLRHHWRPDRGRQAFDGVWSPGITWQWSAKGSAWRVRS